MSYEELVNLRDDLDRTCDRSLQSFVDSSPKCLLIRGRLEAAGNGQRVHMTRKVTPLPVYTSCSGTSP